MVGPGSHTSCAWENNHGPIGSNITIARAIVARKEPTRTTPAKYHITSLSYHGILNLKNSPPGHKANKLSGIGVTYCSYQTSRIN